MQVKEVVSPQDKREFLELPVRLYLHTPNWIRPLDADVEGVFDTVKNKTYHHGECVRWLLLDDAGQNNRDV
jgi:hypothetical protein